MQYNLTNEEARFIIESLSLTESTCKEKLAEIRNTGSGEDQTQYYREQLKQASIIHSKIFYAALENGQYI